MSRVSASGQKAATKRRTSPPFGAFFRFQVYVDLTDEERKCLEDRKYWCFLLSRCARGADCARIAHAACSIVTFCVSMLLVVVWRIITHLFCQPPERESAPQPSAEQKQAVAIGNGGSFPSATAFNVKTDTGGSGRVNAKDEQVQIGWMTEAKVRESARKSSLFTFCLQDWAGELISGQSMTGRILVVLVFLLSIGSLVIYFVDTYRYLASFLLARSSKSAFVFSDSFQVESCIPW